MLRALPTLVTRLPSLQGNVAKGVHTSQSVDCPLFKLLQSDVCGRGAVVEVQAIRIGLLLECGLDELRFAMSDSSLPSTLRPFRVTPENCGRHGCVLFSAVQCLMAAASRQSAQISGDAARRVGARTMSITARKLLEGRLRFGVVTCHSMPIVRGPDAEGHGLSAIEQ